MLKDGLKVVFIHSMYDLCIMGDRYHPYYDGMAILERLYLVVERLHIVS